MVWYLLIFRVSLGNNTFPTVVQQRYGENLSIDQPAQVQVCDATTVPH